ncbi:galectin-1 [Pelobates cultripes]|uniref:Galectin n=1 Tax=Pelobates cultripes TaxID=61616 RepID=A0AAD1SV50_PELCU|nr:galectin-1 [Pelobates cultripes]
MAGVVLNNLNLKKGHCLELKARIPADAKGFCVNLGKDSSNFIIHFNARFDLHGDTNTIVCNSKEGDTWGTEQRESSFPFEQGAETLVCFEYQEDKLIVKLSNGQEFSFPIRMPVDTIDFLSLDGIELKSITLQTKKKNKPLNLKIHNSVGSCENIPSQRSPLLSERSLRSFFVGYPSFLPSTPPVHTEPSSASKSCDSQDFK